MVTITTYDPATRESLCGLFETYEEAKTHVDELLADLIKSKFVVVGDETLGWYATAKCPDGCSNCGGGVVELIINIGSSQELIDPDDQWRVV